jgi:hypothetical protein
MLRKRMEATNRDHQTTRATPVQCAERTCSNGLYWQGWRANRTSEPETGEPPAVAFNRPICATEEFGEGGSVSATNSRPSRGMWCREGAGAT